MEKHLDFLVRQRANERCEYCRLPQSARRLRFQIDHIIAEQHGGETELSNLALSCGRCNRHKGPNLAGFDPITKSIIRLFHPRTDRWGDHFKWNGAVLRGISEIGRVTVSVLEINDTEEIATRLELIRLGIFDAG